MHADMSKHPIIVQKYGGSSVSTPQKIQEVAQLIKTSRDKKNRLCVVVSAMGKTTDQLLANAKEISQNPSRRELDMLLSCGERASMALLAMALHELGVPSISLTGSQSGIITDNQHSGAKIIEVRPHRVQKELDLDKVVIVAGFQGVSFQKEITTLGRGGSDTTAVALAAALNAEACEIYSDVAGVYSADPKIVSSAHILNTVSFEDMETLASLGAKVLNQDAVAFARRHNIKIFARKTGDSSTETIITDTDKHKNSGLVAITHRENLLRLRLSSAEKLAELMKRLAVLGIAPSQIFGFFGQDSIPGSIYCFVALEDAHGVQLELESISQVQADNDFGSVSLVGHGIFSGRAFVSTTLEILKKHHISIGGICTTPKQASFAIPQKEVLRAVQLLHEELFAEENA